MYYIISENNDHTASEFYSFHVNKADKETPKGKEPFGSCNGSVGLKCLFLLVVSVTLGLCVWGVKEKCKELSDDANKTADVATTLASHASPTPSTVPNPALSVTSNIILTTLAAFTNQIKDAEADIKTMTTTTESRSTTLLEYLMTAKIC